MAVSAYKAFLELDHPRWPFASTLAKQLSMILRFSSSNRSARVMLLPGEAGEAMAPDGMPGLRAPDRGSDGGGPPLREGPAR